MSNAIYSSGDMFGNLMLTGKSYLNDNKIRYVEFICVCGEAKFSRLTALRFSILSCGCLRYDNMPKTHGLSGHKLYNGVWSDMIQRCGNKNNDAYHNYGGRGIFVCDAWLNAETFIRWSELNGWYEGCNLQLDRLDNDMGYSPSNCKWNTRAVQNRNKRNNYFVTAFGETKILPDWGNDYRCKVHFSQIKYRIEKMGWKPEIAISTPMSTKKAVLQFTLNGKFIRRWDGCREAGRGIDIKSSSNISMCCRGILKKAAGFIWEFENK